MKMKRIISAILASLMLVGTLASCAAGGENVETTNAATDVVTEEETLISANLPDELDYGGDEVTMPSLSAIRQSRSSWVLRSPALRTAAPAQALW